MSGVAEKAMLHSRRNAASVENLGSKQKLLNSEGSQELLGANALISPALQIGSTSFST